MTPAYFPYSFVYCMSVAIIWQEIALRLACTVVAGALIGLNRGEGGHTAGLRTTLLVCLAASLSMIQANLLLGLTGKAGNSFVVLDLMRLPLGILSGMGFIGAGAIVRRGNLVAGVTTAATLWFVTVMGLCFGGGQLALGGIALILGLLVLLVFKWLEAIIPTERSATFAIEVTSDGPTDEAISVLFEKKGMRLKHKRMTFRDSGRQRRLSYSVRWHGKPATTDTPEFLQDLARMSGVTHLDWLT